MIAAQTAAVEMIKWAVFDVNSASVIFDLQRYLRLEGERFVAPRGAMEK
jgi:hypothetical protein